MLDLRKWALENGSERLKLMLELQVGRWEEVADDEYTDAHAPKYRGAKFSRKVWTDTRHDSDREMRECERPTLEELRALKTIREECESQASVLQNPLLSWCVVTSTRKFSVLSVGVRVPSRGVTRVALSFECGD